MLKFLLLVKDMAGGSVDLVAAFLKAGYGASGRKFEYEFEKQQNKREDARRERQIRHKYFSLLSRLKQAGLVMQDSYGIFALTSVGKDKLKELLTKKKVYIPTTSYLASTANYFVIVAFDIPEKERHKRDWLRAVLKNLGLHMVQRSFWMGKIKLPTGFIHDIHRLGLDSCVEIFQVTKTGTLKHIA